MVCNVGEGRNTSRLSPSITRCLRELMSMGMSKSPSESTTLLLSTAFFRRFGVIDASPVLRLLWHHSYRLVGEVVNITRTLV